MKNFIIKLTLICAISINSIAQVSKFQRVVMIPANVEIMAGAVSANIASFCYDAARSSPSPSSIYKYVHSGGEQTISIGGNAPISFQEALDKNYLKLELSGYKSIRIRNLTNKSLKYVNSEPLLIGDVKNDTKGIKKEVLALAKNKTTNQRTLWRERDKYIFNEHEIEVLLKEGLLNNDNPSVEQLDKARIDFKEKYKTTTSNYNLVINSRYNKIVEANIYLNKKIKVYQKAGILPADGTLNPADISKYDELYKKSKNLTTDIQLKISIETQYYNIQLVEEEVAYKARQAEDLRVRKEKVYQKAGILPADGTLNPADISKYDELYKKSKNLTTDAQLKSDIETQYYNILRAEEEAAYEVRRAEELLIKKEKVYQKAGILPADGVLDPVDISKYDELYKKSKNLTTDVQLKSDVETQYYSIQRAEEEATYEAGRAEDLRVKKEKVYQKAGILSADGVLDPVDISKYDELYKKSKNLTTDVQLKSDVETQYYSIQRAEEEAIYKARRAEDLRVKKIKIFYKEKLITNTEPTESELSNAEEIFKAKFNTTNDALAGKINSLWSINQENIDNSQLLFDEIGIAEEDFSETLKLIEKEMGLDAVGDISVSNATESLSYIYIHVYPFLPKNRKGDVTKFLNDLKLLKKEIGLSENIKIDEAAKMKFSQLSKIIRDKNIYTNDILNTIIDDKKIFLVTPKRNNNSRNAFDDDFNDEQTYFTASIDFSNLLFKSYDPLIISDDAYGLQKITSDIYQVDDRIVKIENLFSTIEDIKPNKNEDPSLNLGTNLTEQDIQGIIKTTTLKKVATKNTSNLSKFNVTNERYDASKVSIIQRTRNYLEIIFNRRNNVPPNSGLIASEVIFQVNGIATQLITKAKNIVNDVVLRMRVDKKLNFSVALIKDFRAANVNFKEFGAVVKNMEIVFNFIKYSNIKIAYEGKNRKYKTKSVFTSYNYTINQR